MTLRSRFNTTDTALQNVAFARSRKPAVVEARLLRLLMEVDSDAPGAYRLSNGVYIYPIEQTQELTDFGTRTLNKRVRTGTSTQLGSHFYETETLLAKGFCNADFECASHFGPQGILAQIAEEGQFGYRDFYLLYDNPSERTPAKQLIAGGRGYIAQAKLGTRNNVAVISFEIASRDGWIFRNAATTILELPAVSN